MRWPTQRPTIAPVKKWLLFLVMVWVFGSVHALTMAVAHGVSAHDGASVASHMHPCNEPVSDHPGSPAAPHAQLGGHACCTALGLHSEPFVFPTSMPALNLAPSPLLGSDLGLASAIFKPPKSRV